MATSKPVGLAQLESLGSVLVRQKTRMSIQNKYVILSPEGKIILFGKEDSGVLNAMFGGNSRSFHIDVFDTNEVEVMTLRRPYTFGPDKMDVTVCKRLTSIVRQEFTFLKPVLSINDAKDRPVLRIKGPIGQTGVCDFKIYTRDKQQIGVIRKKWGGVVREMFTDSDNYRIEFPVDLDVNFKAAIIGACFLIDFLYYEH